MQTQCPQITSKSFRSLFAVGLPTIAYGLTQPFLMRLTFATAEAKINKHRGELHTLCDSPGNLNTFADTLGAIGVLGRASFAIKMLYGLTNGNNKHTRKKVILYGLFFIGCGIPAGFLNAYNTYNAGVYYMYDCITPTRSEPIPIPLIIASLTADIVPAIAITIILPPAIISEIKDWVTLLTQCIWKHKPLFPNHNRRIQLLFHTTAQLKVIRDELLTSGNLLTLNRSRPDLQVLPKQFYILKALLIVSMYLANEACLNYLTYSRETITATSEHFFPNNKNHTYNFTRPPHNFITDTASNSSYITSLLLNGLLLNSIFFGLLLRRETVHKKDILTGLAVLIPTLCVSIPGMVNTLFNDELTKWEMLLSCAANVSTSLVFVMLGLSDFVKTCLDPEYEPHEKLIGKTLKLEERPNDENAFLLSPPTSPHH